MAKKRFSDEELRQRQYEASRRWKERNKNHVQEKSRQWYRDRTKTKEGYAQLHLKSAKSRCSDTDLDIEYLLQLPDKCAITDRPFEYSNRFQSTCNPLAPSIDRIDSGKGYYKGNVQLVFDCVNKMKNDMNNEEFKTLWGELQSHEY